jgi:2-iminobutanoate/2-iminopropanoate deaminase
MKTVISTDKAPKAVGPYSQAIQTGNLLFCSGQIAIDPVTSELISGGVEHQTQRVMENIEELLEAAGSSLDQVVKATIFLKSMDDYAVVNEVYGSFFDKTSAPARECVQVAKLPLDVDVEISVIAVCE